MRAPPSGCLLVLAVSLFSCSSFIVEVRPSERPPAARLPDDAHVALAGGPFATMAKRLADVSAAACRMKAGSSPVIEAAADAIDWDTGKMSAGPLAHVASVGFTNRKPRVQPDFEDIREEVTAACRELGANACFVRSMTKTQKQLDNEPIFQELVVEAYAVDCEAVRAPTEPATSVRRVPIIVTDDAYEPSEVRAQPNELVHLVFTRETKAPCSDEVVLGGEVTTLPLEKVAVVEVRAPAEATRLTFGCPGERLRGAVVVSSDGVDPGLEHPLMRKPLPLDYAASLVGKPAPEWTVPDWDGTDPLSLAGLRGRVVVVRFYMDECPFCRATLPALAKLNAKFSDDDVVFVGLFHSKPRGTESDWKTAVTTARTWGADFALGYDRMWTTLEAWYGDRLGRSPTSVTFVVDREGRFAFVHPGPVYHPSTHPDHARCDSDFDAVETAIRAAVESK